MPENLVSFPASPRVAPAVAHACAVFLERWNGEEIADGARQLSDLLPEHVPGPLKLVILRATRQLDVPPFPTVESFRAAVSRFTAGEPELRTLGDVRRARRHTRLTLDTIARQASLPVYLLRQLEWGDFRQWHNDEWAERVARAYARGAKLDPDRVLTIINEERHEQLQSGTTHDHRRVIAADAAPAGAQLISIEPVDTLSLHVPAGPSILSLDSPVVPQVRRPARMRRFGLAAAAVAMFAAGLGVGGAIVQQRSSRDPGTVALRQPVSQPRTQGTTTDTQSGPSENPSDAVAPSAPESDVPAAAAVAQRASGEPAGDAASSVVAERQPEMTSASSAGAPAFSPSFSNVGGAVFYHRDEGVGTALVKADRDETTGDLRVINIVEDNARNYHVRPSPDGSQIAFDSDRDGERGVYVANADGTGVRRVSGDGFAAVPSWSPDGSLLAFVRAERDRRTWNLWLLNLQTNETRRVTDYQYGQPWGASWFPDGRRVAYSHEDRLTVLDLPTGTKRMFKSPRAGRLVRTPAVSPDGRHIVFQVYRDGAWMLDLRDSSMARILADPTAEEFAWDSSGRRLAFHSRRSGSWSVWIMAGPSS